MDMFGEVFLGGTNRRQTMSRNRIAKTIGPPWGPSPTKKCNLSLGCPLQKKNVKISCGHAIHIQNTEKLKFFHPHWPYYHPHKHTTECQVSLWKKNKTKA